MRIESKTKDPNYISIYRKGILSSYGLLSELLSENKLDEVTERMLKETEKQ